MGHMKRNQRAAEKDKPGSPHKQGKSSTPTKQSLSLKETGSTSSEMASPDAKASLTGAVSVTMLEDEVFDDRESEGDDQDVPSKKSKLEVEEETPDRGAVAMEIDEDDKNQPNTMTPPIDPEINVGIEAKNHGAVGIGECEAEEKSDEESTDDEVSEEHWHLLGQSLLVQVSNLSVYQLGRRPFGLECDTAESDESSEKSNDDKGSALARQQANRSLHMAVVSAEAVLKSDEEMGEMSEGDKSQDYMAETDDSGKRFIHFGSELYPKTWRSQRRTPVLFQLALAVEDKYSDEIMKMLLLEAETEGKMPKSAPTSSSNTPVTLKNFVLSVFHSGHGNIDRIISAEVARLRWTAYGELGKGKPSRLGDSAMARAVVILLMFERVFEAIQLADTFNFRMKLLDLTIQARTMSNVDRKLNRSSLEAFATKCLKTGRYHEAVAAHLVLNIDPKAVDEAIRLMVKKKFVWDALIIAQYYQGPTSSAFRYAFEQWQRTNCGDRDRKKCLIALDKYGELVEELNKEKESKMAQL